MKKKLIRLACALPLLAVFNASWADESGIVSAPSSGIVNTLHPLHAECVIYRNFLPPQVFGWTFAIPSPYDARARANTVYRVYQNCQYISQGRPWAVNLLNVQVS